MKTDYDLSEVGSLVSFDSTTLIIVLKRNVGHLEAVIYKIIMIHTIMILRFKWIASILGVIVICAQVRSVGRMFDILLN